MTKAVICGHDGNIWAVSKDFNVTVKELKTLLFNYGDAETLAKTGVTIAGTKYMYLSKTDKVIRAKKGTSGIHTIKTTQAFRVEFLAKEGKLERSCKIFCYSTP